MFRDLKAHEIECKVSSVKKNGVVILLYKTARTDMDILDETFSCFNWTSEYKEIKGNLYCGISVYDDIKKQWVTKWDCGVESAFGDKEKAEASDAFKRSGFKWGIGRELYTAPFIFVPAENCKIVDGKCFDKFVVEKIKIVNKQITNIAIYNASLKKRAFVY